LLYQAIARYYGLEIPTGEIILDYARNNLKHLIMGYPKATSPFWINRIYVVFEDYHNALKSHLVAEKRHVRPSKLPRHWREYLCMSISDQDYAYGH
jgi:hypothetical protein